MYEIETRRVSPPRTMQYYDTASGVVLPINIIGGWSNGDTAAGR